MIKLEFYVPKNYLQEVKEALFLKGAGTLGNYNSVSWEVLGKGQFFPTSESSPFIGERGKLEHLEEYKVEMICKEELIQDIIQALKDSHPYETPAYAYWNVQV
jgi:hypothetical protein